MSKNSKGSSSQPFDFERENKFLKMTISELRNKMEELQIKQEEKIQLTKSISSDEISQLQDTVSTLRIEMEKTSIDKEMFT